MQLPTYMHASNGIRVTVRPEYAPEHSLPGSGRFVFVYRIRIDNEGERTIQLLRRHWHIHDAVAGDSEVEGEGVVGDQPVVAPGDMHEYQSFVVLQGPDGHMEGEYRIRRTDGVEFDAPIPRFLLDAGDATR